MRNIDGTFKGSGNKAGRPKGIPDKRTALRRELEKHGSELLAVALEQALAGDPAALRLCLERIMPPVKANAEPVTFDLSGDTITEKAHSILDAVADGEIDPITGKALIEALGTLCRITEIDQLQQRLEQLEKHLLHASKKP